MATRIEQRGLKERVNALRSSVYRMSRMANFGSADLTRKSSISRFRTYLNQTRTLARVVRRLNPNDRAWDYYDKNIEKSVEYFEEGLRWKHLKGYAISELHHALDMVQGAVSRILPGSDANIRQLASDMLWNETERGREDARHVLIDVLHERGYDGEANALRARKGWELDKRVLSDLKLGVPQNAPYHYKKPSTPPERDRVRFKGRLIGQPPKRKRRVR